jgi:SAM-dependent methyltransferase
MRSIIDAVLGATARRLLLLDPPKELLGLADRPTTTLIVVASPRRRLLRRCRSALDERRLESARRPPVALVAARVEALPFARPRFDAVVAAAGLTSRPAGQPVAALRALGGLLRPGGALVVASRLREGDLGVAASLARRLVDGRVLPSATELATWMLVAGLRGVRQARLVRTVVPAALTWATARPKPWLDALVVPPEPADASDRSEAHEPALAAEANDLAEK